MSPKPIDDQFVEESFVLKNDEVEAVLAWYSSAACDFGALTPGMQGFLHRLYRWYPEHGQW